jgi:AraC-like DNA-binding protein
MIDRAVDKEKMRRMAATKEFFQRSLSEMSARSGIAKTTIHRMLRGETACTESQRRKLEEALR